MQEFATRRTTLENITAPFLSSGSKKPEFGCLIAGSRRVEAVWLRCLQGPEFLVFARLQNFSY